MKRRAPGKVLALTLLSGAGVTLGACPPATHDRAALESLKSSDFEVADDARRQSLAIALADCLAHSDPWLRDGVALAAESIDSGKALGVLEALVPLSHGKV